LGYNVLISRVLCGDVSLIRKDCRSLPLNNFWYEPAGERGAIVFVHGIFSQSRTAWLSDEPGGTYWPDLILDDARLSGMAIFMGGYHTTLASGSAEIRDCSDQLFQSLKLIDAFGNPPPLSKSQLVFVCHSTGGIVVRYMLVNHSSAFREKKIGLLLIASPSGGSQLARLFRGIARLYNNRLFQQLEWDSWSLRNLDQEFKNLRNDRTIPGLVGMEAREARFVYGHRWLPNISLVVSDESAGRYFGAARLLPDTDHSTAVKPNSRFHPAHTLLVEAVDSFCKVWNTPTSDDLARCEQITDSFLTRIDPRGDSVPD
jgi:triacylglycerol esterase/lipase EstA (alpha/beta hydrolase family)